MMPLAIGMMSALSNKHRARLQLEETTIVLLQSKELLGFVPTDSLAPTAQSGNLRALKSKLLTV